MLIYFEQYSYVLDPRSALAVLRSWRASQRLAVLQTTAKMFRNGKAYQNRIVTKARTHVCF